MEGKVNIDDHPDTVCEAAPPFRRLFLEISDIAEAPRE
jgi:hypothetical protein